MEDRARLLRRTSRPARPDTGDFRFRDLVERSQDVVIVTDAVLDRPGPFIRYVNPAFTRLTGWQASEVIGRSPRVLQGPGTDRAALEELGRALRTERRAAMKLLNYSRDGTPYWLDCRIEPLFDDGGQLSGFVAFERDVSLDKQRFDELEHLADRDTLTGIPNRRALTRAAEAALAAGAGVCFAWLDIDHFKRINDGYGHAAGDAVLMGVADLLAENIRRADLVGRMGGEEFAICMPGLSVKEAQAVTERLRCAVADAVFPTGSGPLRVTCSLGLSASRPGESLAELMQRADAALYVAKRGGRNRVAIG